MEKKERRKRRSLTRKVALASPPPNEPHPDKSGTEQCKARRLGNIGISAAVRCKTGGERPCPCCAGSGTGERTDCCIGPISVVGQHRRIGSPQSGRIGDLEADLISGVGITVKEIEAQIELSKTVNLTG